MRHNVERYRMLLRTESNPRARWVLIDMIAELESRPAISRIRIPLAKDGPPVVRRHVSATPASAVAHELGDVPLAADKLH
jgi:hypothetical protein